MYCMQHACVWLTGDLSIDAAGSMNLQPARLARSSHMEFQGSSSPVLFSHYWNRQITYHSSERDGFDRPPRKDSPRDLLLQYYSYYSTGDSTHREEEVNTSIFESFRLSTRSESQEGGTRTWLIALESQAVGLLSSSRSRMVELRGVFRTCLGNFGIMPRR